MMKKIYLPFLLLLLLTSCKKDIYRSLIEVEKAPVNLAILNVSIFDGKEAVLKEHQDIFIENGYIKTIAPAGQQSPENYYQVDGKGKVIMPGLIDAHVHTGSNGEVPWQRVKTDEEHTLHAYLYAGITTVYDLGGFAKATRKLSEKQQKGKLIAPDIYFTHSPITVPNGHPIPIMKELAPWPINKMVAKAIVQIKEVDDAPKIIKKYEKMQVDYIKIILEDLPPGTPVMNRELLTALIDEAHQKGYKVFVHIGTVEQALMAIDAGADVLAHGIYRHKLTKQQAQQIADSGVPIIYTLAPFENVYQIGSGAYQPTELDREISPAELLDPVTGASGKKFNEYQPMVEFYEEIAENREYWAGNVDLLNEAGATFIVGTDSPLPGSYPGSSIHQEMQLLKTYGLSNLQILQGATYHSARLFINNPDFGTVEEGKKANLLLLRGNPVDNLSHVQNIEKIVVEGKVIERELP